jgi:hypothetical protein
MKKTKSKQAMQEQVAAAAGPAPVESVPEHNSAGEGMYPLRSGLAQAGDANPTMGYYGGSQ